MDGKQGLAKEVEAALNNLRSWASKEQKSKWIKPRLKLHIDLRVFGGIETHKLCCMSDQHGRAAVHLTGGHIAVVRLRAPSSTTFSPILPPDLLSTTSF